MAPRKLTRREAAVLQKERGVFASGPGPCHAHPRHELGPRAVTGGGIVGALSPTQETPI